MNQVECSTTGEESKRPAPTRYLQIDPGRRRRWLGWLMYLLIFAATCAAVIGFFLYFAVPVSLAVVIVVLMVGYMVAMGWWASRNLEGKK